MRELCQQKNQLEKRKNNKKKNRIQTYAASLVLVAIGLFFLFSLFNIPFGGLGWFLTMALGVCFSIWGLVNLALEVKEYRQARRNR